MTTDVISPDPVTEWHPRYLPAYLSNGVVGLRVGKIPMANGVAILSGFEGQDPTYEVEAFARVPYPLDGADRGRPTMPASSSTGDKSISHTEI